MISEVMVLNDDYEIIEQAYKYSWYAIIKEFLYGVTGFLITS